MHATCVQKVPVLRFSLSFAVLTAGLASDQINPVVVSGGGQNYAARSSTAREANSFLIYEYVPVTVGSLVRLYSRPAALHFVQDVKAFRPSTSGGQKNALLLRLKGQLMTFVTQSMAEVGQPLSSTSDAR